MAAFVEALMVRQADPPGARESSAGDEFHILWAVQRALAMLELNTQLQRVVIEGMSPLDPSSSSPSLLLGADLTEYYGGEYFSNSHEVRVTQLKYSSRNPNRAWTAARLAEAGSRKQSGVLARLAEIFSVVRSNHPRDEVLKKLRLRLVSNQPANPKLLGLKAAVDTVLSARQQPVNLATILNGLKLQQQKDLLRLYAASRLSKRDFTDFLRVLDIDSLGVEDRWRQEARIVFALGNHLVDGADEGARALFHFVRKEALPEGRGSLGLRREDVLAHLGVSSWNALFPMPSRVILPKTVIPTPDATRLAEAALEGDVVVVAHGDAGVGKTTTIARLEEELPQGSVVITYDCFGAGEFLSAAETRHRVGPALLQIINDIGLRCGSSLLLQVPREEAFLWQRLEGALRDAGAAVSAVGGRVVLAIDAADNAIVAGRYRSEPTFVPDLWTLRLPPGVSLLVSCRTHRLADMAIPDHVSRVELRGFDEEASARHLRGRFEGAEDEVCQVFHQRSNGNPRSQFYVLDPSRTDSADSPEEAVNQARITPKEIFEDLVRAAVEQASEPARARDHLADLVCLTRPVEIGVFAGATGLPIDRALAFCRGLVPGARIEGSSVAFRDEDFEAYLRSELLSSDVLTSHSRLADYFLALREVDASAAIVVAEHLALAGRDGELIALAVGEDQPAAVVDPVARLQTYFRRLELAMHAATQPEWRRNALRLTILAASAARTDQAVAAIVHSRPDLAIRHGDPHAVARIFEESHSDPWRGPLHLRVAALYARSGDLSRAEEQLRLADAWIRRWMTLDENERSGWQLEEGDVAAGAQAVYWLHGGERARDWLRRWRPLTFVVDASARLVNDLGALKPSEEIFSELEELALPVWVEARLLSVLFRTGHLAPSQRVSLLVGSLLSGRRPSESRRGAAWMVDFVELAARVTRDTSSVLNLLEFYDPPLPDRAPHEWEGLGSWEAPLRLASLKAICQDAEVNIEELIPPRLREDAPRLDSYRDQEQLEGERRTLKSLLNGYLPTLLLRADALVHQLSSDTVARAVQEELVRREKAASDRWQRPDRSFRLWAELASQALLAAEGEATDLVSRMSEVAPVVAGYRGFGVLLSLGRLLLPDPRYRDLALRLLDRVASETESSEEPAPERAERLLEVAGLVDPYEADLAGDYFGRAIRAAEGLDDEGAGVLAVQARLASLCSSQPSDKRAHLAERLARANERFLPFVSDVDRLPWSATAEAVAALDPVAALALASRWEDEDRMALGASLDHMLPSIHDQGFLPAEIALALLPISAEDTFRVQTAIALLESLRREGGSARGRLGISIQHLSLVIRRDFLPDTRLTAARSLGAWASDNGLEDMPGVPELLELTSFSDALHDSIDRSPQTGFVDSSDRRKKAAALIESAGRDRPDELEHRLEELADQWASEQEIREYLDRFGRELAPSDRVAALQALADLPATGRLWHFHAEALLHALGGWLSAWSTSSAVSGWVQNQLPRMLRNHFVSLVAYEQAADITLPLVMSMPGLSDPATVIVQALGPILSNLGPGELHAVARTLALALSAEEQVEALDWSLARLEAGDAPPPPTLPEESGKAVASFLWALFGHPDKRVRWRAAHAGRQLSTGNDLGVASELVRMMQQHDAGPFVSKDHEFLWMSAQQWAVLLLARIADEAPEVLADQRHRLAQFALDDEWPHASVRELARRAVLALDSHDPFLEPAARSRLAFANRPVACHVERGSHWPRSGGSTPGVESSFSFDWTDTIPYWYEPLARVFALDVAEISQRAENWIVRRLFYTEAQAREDHSPRAANYDYEDTGNRHGSLPRVERLHTYLEYHAMLLVAGELVAEGHPVSVESYEAPGDPWADWLDRHLDASPHQWMVDLRGLAPLAPETYGALGPRDRWRSRSPNDFDRELGLEEIGRQAIVVDSYIEVSSSDRYGHASVKSALVTPDTAHSLLRALQTCKDPRNYRLPLEQLDHVEQVQIDEPGFMLLGWNKEGREEEDGLEEHDPLRRVRPSFTVPGRAFTSHHRLKAEKDQRTQVTPDGRVVSWVELWSDEASRQRSYERAGFTAGRKTWVKIPDLVDFLFSQGLDLIFEVHISRQFAERARGEEEHDYESGESRIYLLRRSGAMETLDGSRQIG
jgi:hypothetical protein